MSEALNDDKVLDKLNEVLEDKKTALNISLDDRNVIKIEEKDLTVSENKKIINEVKKKESSFDGKFLKSFYKVFESFLDSVTKTFLKKKYKINNSVYNDGKKAIIAIHNKDLKTFLKKSTDSILNLLKKIPTDTRKIIKNTKNVAIDEIYSWKS